jgi:hypothetical protein
MSVVDIFILEYGVLDSMILSCNSLTFCFKYEKKTMNMVCSSVGTWERTYVARLLKSVRDRED